MKLLIAFVLLLHLDCTFGQTGTNFLPVILQDQHIHDQNISKCMGGEIESPSSEALPYQIDGNSQVEFISSTSIRLMPGFSVTNYRRTGALHDSIA